MRTEICGHRVRLETVIVRGQAYRIYVPARGEALLDDPRVIERFERDEYMPYWAMLWPAAALLAEVVAQWEPRADDATPVLELGCGLGLVGLVLLARGYPVIMTDHDPDALVFAAESARLNDLPAPRTRSLDWHDPHEKLAAACIVAADVLYEARQLEPVANFIRRSLQSHGIALICDPYRRTADRFEPVARSCGLAVTVDAVERGPARGRVFRLRQGG